MSQSAYPSLAEVTAYAAALGITVDSTQATQTLAAAIDEWEERTRFVPFLADSSDSVAYFDADGSGVLSLPGYVSITSVYTGITATESGGTVTYSDGTRSYADVGHYVLKEWNRVLSPITMIQWKTGVMPGIRSVKITGKRGAFVALPDTVWQAILECAGSRSAAISLSTPPGYSEIEITGDARVKFGGFSESVTAAEKKFSNAIATYRRAVL